MKNISIFESKFLKKSFLACIKYGPPILAITCCIKLYLIPFGHEIILLHIVNVLLNLYLIFMFFIAGKYFRYCWKHRSLCRITLGGILYCAAFMIFDTPNKEITPLVIFYIIFVLLITISYRSI